MHMADALLSPAAGATMYVASAAAIAYSVSKIKANDLGEKKVPVMAVSGAMVFAGQMINFTIPATGSSGHIGGGMLLAGLLGAFPALLAIAAVLIIQCLFFADGGLLALGCNIFNMGVIPCLIVYPLIYKRILSKGITYKRIGAASIVGVVVGLQLGAFGVVAETALSGITELPFGAFVLLMQPIHLAIGVVEGIVTAAVLSFVFRMRPELLESATSGQALPKTVSLRRVLTALVVVAVCVGGLLSLFASANPDGLEWAMERVAGTAELETAGGVFDRVASLRDAFAFLPDYGFPSGEAAAGTSVSGIVGGVLTFALAGLAGLSISLFKKRRGKEASRA